MEYYSAIKKNETMPFAATWMDLGIIMVSKSGRERQISYDITYMWNLKKKKMIGTSLVAQWLRIRLPMQGTRVQALVREDPTCSRATRPVHHNC